MNSHQPLLLTGLVAVLAIATAAPAAADPGGPEGLCPYLEVSTVESPTSFDQNSFSVTATSDLLVHIVFPEEFVQEHVVTLRFFTPGGHLYREIDVPVATSLGDRSAVTRRLAGYPYPVRVRAPEAMAVRSLDVRAIPVAFPVGGTTIGSSSLYGSWMVKVLVDGKPTRCVQPLVFEVTE